jgi:spore maturation protein SpmA
VTIVSATVVVAVRAPEVPVIVTVVGPPAAAEPLAVSVSVLVPAVGFGLNNAVTPLGRTDVARLTLPVNPPTSVTVMVLAPPAPPAAIVTLLGAADSVKPGVELTVRATVVVAVSVPEVPVIVTVVGPPVAAEPLAVSVSVLVPAVGFGLNNAVTPLGRTDVARVTLPVNPPTSVTVMVLAPPAPPGVIVILPDAAESVKLGVVALVQEWTRL